VAIPKIAEQLTDSQLVSFCGRPETKAQINKTNFWGRFYTLEGGELRLESKWPAIKAALVKLTAKHGDNLRTLLEACYQIIVEKDRKWDNLQMIESVAKDLGAGKGMRSALTDLQLIEVVEKNKGDLNIPPELTLLLREHLDESESKVEVDKITEEGEQVAIPQDLFDVVFGYDDVKKLFLLSLQSEHPVHILLVGPPATAKSVFLMELKRLSGCRFAIGGTSSKAGIVDFIIDQRPRYLLIDELEKMDMKDYSALLSLMADGIVARLKKGMTEEIRVKTWIFAAANKDEKLPRELRSRFATVYLKEYTEQEFKRVTTAVLVKRDHVNEDIAAKIADIVVVRSRDVREAQRIAWLYGKGQHGSIDDVVELYFKHAKQVY
jgi:Holliday junction DNA helicase RuvB